MGNAVEMLDVAPLEGVVGWHRSTIGGVAGDGLGGVVRGQDGRVVKASFSVRLAMVTRGFETRLQILPSKELLIVRRDGFNHVRDSIWRRHLPIF